MSKYFLSFLVLTAVSLTGCSASNEAPIEPQILTVSQNEYDRGFDVFAEKELALSLYEPAKGCLSGAYILSDKPVAGDISKFEELTGKEHGFYTYFLKMGQPFPTEWLLDCIANMKTPNIVLVPENYDNPYNAKYLAEISKKFGEFYVPIFIHLYPINENYGLDGQDYKAFYKIAKAYFKEYASNVAFVWDLDISQISLMENFYPGDEYVDWVGLNICVNSYGEEGLTFSRALSALDYLYFTYQERKPIFISQLAISHFDAQNHVYTVNEAKYAMEGFYKKLEDKYPRVKAVNYMSYNSLEPVNMKGSSYNYSVADNGRITAIYTDCVEGNYFLSNLDYSAGGDKYTQRIRYPVEAIYSDGEFFVERGSLDILSYATGITPSQLSKDNKAIFPLSNFFTSPYTINGDFDKRAVNIKKY